jgi:hypothetical protein
MLSAKTPATEQPDEATRNRRSPRREAFMTI